MRRSLFINEDSMFAHLTGKVLSAVDGTLVLDVAGVGFALQVPKAEQFQGKGVITMAVHLHWNQENGPTMFGFATEMEKRLFLLVIGCSGIGPKMALSLIEQLSPTILIKAVQENDEKVLSSVSGIGPKKAEQIIVQLRHKITKLLDIGLSSDDVDLISLQDWKNVTQVLQSLNYSKGEIDAALNHLKKNTHTTVQFDVLVRQALSFLSKR